MYALRFNQILAPVSLLLGGVKISISLLALLDFIRLTNHDDNMIALSQLISETPMQHQSEQK